MSRLRFTPVSRDDLEEIWEFIAQDNLDAAEALLKAIEEKCELLASSPSIGRRRDELAEDLRSLPHDSYLIFYRMVADGVLIVRVLHAARDVASLF